MGMPQMAASMARRSSVRFVSSAELNRPGASCASALDASATKAIASEMWNRFICLPPVRLKQRAAFSSGRKRKAQRQRKEQKIDTTPETAMAGPEYTLEL